MIISKKAFDYLLEHMLDVNDRKVQMIMPYAMDYDVYMSMLNFFNGYVQKIGDFLDTATVEDVAFFAPFVTIGSLVYTDGCNIYDKAAYSVLLPGEYEEKCDKDKPFKVYSCIAPTAKELLFKSCGDEVVIEQDGKTRRCIINTIDYQID